MTSLMCVPNARVCIVLLPHNPFVLVPLTQTIPCEPVCPIPAARLPKHATVGAPSLAAQPGGCGFYKQPISTAAPIQPRLASILFSTDLQKKE
jgi:hypothetical protein